MTSSTSTDHGKSDQAEARSRGRVAGLWALTTRGGRAAEALVVVGMLVVLELVVFADHWSGEVTIPWDFVGTYNAEAFAWWADGGIVDPPQWMPYQWGGYPAAASVQNSASYLPVGLMATLVPFSLHAATVLHALHVAWGAAGVYVLARRWSMGRAAAAFGLVAYFFAVGFYSNAQHVDIVRGFAWAPWLLLCVSPWWHWRRWWGIPAAGIIFWQMAVSTYPGLLVQLAYGAALLVVVFQTTTRTPWRHYLAPLAAAGAAGVLLAVQKYLPNLLTRGFEGAAQERDQVFDLGVVGTLFFPYDLDFLPNDVTMRSFFVVAGVLTLAVFATFRSHAWWAGTSLVLTGVVLGIPGPWSPVVAVLPGMSLSRFQLADSRVVIVVGLVIVAMAGLARLVATIRADGPSLFGPVRIVALVAVGAGSAAVAVTAGYPAEASRGPWVLTVVATLVAVCAASPLLRGRGSAAAGAFAVIFVVLAAISGTTWANGTPRPWRTDRAVEEAALWGAPSEDLIARRDTGAGEARRPGRVPLPEAATDWDARWSGWSRSYYDGRASLGGYVNLLGVPAFERVHELVMTDGPLRLDANRFWSAPGVMIADVVDGIPTAPAITRCVESQLCGPGLAVLPAGYDLDTWRYRATASVATRVVLNESYYNGFTVTACDGECLDLVAAQAFSGGVSFELPAGTWDVTVVYRAPGSTAAWVSFTLGALVLLAGALSVIVQGRTPRARRDRSRR